MRQKLKFPILPTALFCLTYIVGMVGLSCPTVIHPVIYGTCLLLAGLILGWGIGVRREKDVRSREVS